MFLPSRSAETIAPAMTYANRESKQARGVCTGFEALAWGRDVNDYRDAWECSQGRVRADFSVALSIHNASEALPLILKRIAHFDTGGNLVEKLLMVPIALK